MNITELTTIQKDLILKLYEEQIMPDWFWRKINYENIWKFSNTKIQKIERRLQGDLFIRISKLLYYMNPARNFIKKRLVDKSISNCLRLDIVKQVFPNARFIYIKRNGIDTIKSLIYGWQNPARFTTFSPPEPLHITGYEGQDWKFVMPAGWREFTGRHLSEVCTWQWKTCHEKILEFKSGNPEKILEIKLEDLNASPASMLKNIADFTDLPYENFSAYINKLPEVNKTPAQVENGFPFPEKLQEIKEQIRPLMEKLGYA